MGNTRPLGMARETSTTWWCSHCGVSLAAAPGGSFRCAFCGRGTHVQHHRRGAGERDVSPPVPFSSPPRPMALGSMMTRREVPASYPRVCGKKRALLVGVSYAGTAYELKGTVNDVKQMRRLLCEQFAFPSGCILELTGN